MNNWQSRVKNVKEDALTLGKALRESELMKMLWQILVMAFTVIGFLAVLALLVSKVWPVDVDNAKEVAEVVDYVLWRIVGWGTSLVVFITGFVHIFEGLKRAARGDDR